MSHGKIPQIDLSIFIFIPDLGCDITFLSFLKLTNHLALREYTTNRYFMFSRAYQYIADFLLLVLMRVLTAFEIRGV